MTSISEEEETLEAAVAGLRRVAEVVASIPEANRAKALDAAESAYRETVRDLGYEEGPAEAWVSAIMVRLQAEVSDKESVNQMPTPTLQEEFVFGSNLNDNVVEIGETVER
jgi:Mg/Co/Ni transporter MgtE